jgi:hypothetical protein
VEPERKVEGQAARGVAESTTREAGAEQQSAGGRSSSERMIRGCRARATVKLEGATGVRLVGKVPLLSPSVLCSPFQRALTFLFWFPWQC